MINLPHLDVNVTAHCNKRCTACSHASPFNIPYYMEESVLADDLSRLKQVVHFARVQLVGGEPTLHPSLHKLMQTAKASGIADSMSVITNGTRLPYVREEVWEEMKILQLSIYDGLPDGIVELCEKKRAQYGFAFHSTEFKEFYLQFKPVADDGVYSFNHCHWKHDCYTVHEGRFYLCPQSLFFPRRVMGMSPESDGLPLSGITEDGLVQFMNRTKPFTACSVCSGGFRTRIPWKESRSLNDWIAESTEP